MPRCLLPLTLLNGSDARAQNVAVNAAVIAGWTGRDPVAVEKHIVELEALGVKRPASTPIFYRVAAARLTTDAEIEASGTQSGGEVEYLLLRHGGRTWVGVGSDHTDREVEKMGVTVSKQMCDKPIANQFWAYDEVARHWDQLILRSFAVENGKRAVYQDGSVAAMLHPKDLLSRFAADGALPDDTLMFCGTLAAHGGVRATDQFAFEIEDPVLRRKIAHEYRVTSLPVLG
jgi:Protein of unknown function (DUF2848)